jgi:hypothetical protein
MNCIHRAALHSANLLGRPKEAHRIDLAAGSPFPFDTTLRFRARARGRVHGVAVWFEARLAPRVRLSNSPSAPGTLWGQGLLPLAKPLSVGKRSLITVDLAVRFSRDAARTWWQWEVTAGGARADGTTFRSFPTSLADLEAGSRERRPGLSPEGEITACVLRVLGSGGRILDAGRALRRRFSGRFGTLGAAVARAGADARRYGRAPKTQDKA